MPEDTNSKERGKGREAAFAKKRFGQHFLTDKNLLNKIVRVSGVTAKDCVLEIGPGQGALTSALIDAGAQVYAIEVDKDLTGALQKRFAGSALFELINADALAVSFTSLSIGRGCKFKAVSNLPYNISGPLIFKFIAERDAFTSMTLMLQKEVAVRLAARPGTKEYGVPSVLCQTYFDVSLEFTVSRNLFTPRPKVDSCVIGFKVLPSPRVRITDEAFFAKTVKAAFSQRRKTLSNALKTLGFNTEKVLAALHRVNIDPKRRGETLDIPEFAALAGAFLEP